MTTWYCNRCGNVITHKNSNCLKCRKLFRWIKDGWFFPSYYPERLEPMTNKEAIEIRGFWNKKLEEVYRKKGIFALLKFKIFGEGNTADRRRRRATTEEMVEIFRRDGHKCIKCSSEYNLTVDHIIPLAKGGTWDMDNLQPMCHSCNSSKGARM